MHPLSVWLRRLVWRYFYLCALFICLWTEANHTIAHADGPSSSACSALDVVMGTFRKISLLYRASSEEAVLRNYIIALAKANQLEFSVDQAGNILVKVPATGPYQHPYIPAIALQSHLDMVMAHKTAAVGEDLRPYFRHGVVLEEKDGWVQSKDRMTTLGADNGIGVAMMIRYMTDHTIAHPELELLFTTHEEAYASDSMVGARNLQLPLQARVIINLDSEEDGVVCYGCQGGSKVNVHVSHTTVRIPQSYTQYTLTLKGLAGGHSGMNIHQHRANAVKVAAALLQGFLKSSAYPSLSILITEIKIGDSDVHNKIPNGFEISLAIPTVYPINEIRDLLNPRIKEVLALYPGEAQDVSLELTPQSNPKHKIALAPAEAGRLLETILKIHNGVTENDTEFPNGVKTSSNLAFLYATPRPGNSGIDSFFGLLARSYDVESLIHITNQNNDLIRSLIANAKIEAAEPFHPWMTGKDSWLLRLSLRELPGYQADVVAGGLELALITKRFPHIQAISLGPTILDAHSTNERFEVRSVARLVPALDHLLGKIADSPDFVLPH